MLKKVASKNNENPLVTLLTPGPHNETYFEHAYLSSFLDLTLVQGEDLLTKNNQQKENFENEELDEKKDNKYKIKSKFSYKEQAEFDTIDEAIAELELKLKQIKMNLETNSADFVKLAELTKKEEELNKELDDLMERWAYLTELAEEMGISK